MPGSYSDARDGARRGDGYGGLHVSRAGAREDGRLSRRYLRLWRDPVRDAGGETRLSAIDRGGHNGGDPERRSSRNFTDCAEHASGVAAGGASLSGEEPRAALSVRVGPGVCAGSVVGVGRLVGRCSALAVWPLVQKSDRLDDRDRRDSCSLAAAYTCTGNLVRITPHLRWRIARSRSWVTHMSPPFRRMGNLLSM